jgi:hypothetical protein
MNNKTEKSIGLRVTPELYSQISEMCEKLDGIAINTFALRCVQAGLELLNSKNPDIPKWIAVSRYSLNYCDKDKS